MCMEYLYLLGFTSNFAQVLLEELGRHANRNRSLPQECPVCGGALGVCGVCFI